MSFSPITGSRPILKIDSLSEFGVLGEDGPVILVGTLYKHQELKPSILKELSNEIQSVNQPLRTDYSLDTDQLFIEDEVLRAKLLGNHPNNRETVTGLVCAVLGNGTEDGAFWVPKNNYLA